MTFFLAYAAVLGAMFLACWMRHRDMFHPWIVLIPQFVFLNAALPLAAWQSDPDRFTEFAGGAGFLGVYQLLTLALPLCLLLGARAGSRRIAPAAAAWLPQDVANPASIRCIAALLGVMAVGSWLYMVARVGGFEAAYGRAYGGGWADSGYVREMRLVGIIGAILVFVLRGGRGMRPGDWALVALCVAPVLVHGLLGARRGPAFVAIVTVAGGYAYFMRRQFSLSLVLPAGILLGLLMLFLVANRGDIYIGSDFDALRMPAAALDRWHSNEYLVGSAVVRYAEAYGGFYGSRELVHLLGRLAPATLWPTVYTDLAAALGLSINLLINAGVDPVAIYALTGWQPSVGSAPGFVGAVWLEFQYAAPLVAWLIGYLYGAVWRAAAWSMSARLVYLLLVSLSVYLVMQDLDAWLYRLVLLGLPMLAVARLVQVRRQAPLPSGAAPAGAGP